ncbi:MAG: low-specificity L-threonine aldolase [Chloroflexi bacterium]|nr:low-specificity L-threonine aldolase [Chloroflexota bacterium]
MYTIDLRSDTVTHPTEAMRKAMYEAEVGDDVYGEDPTVTRLEEYAAAMLGKEAALFAVSGTMGNLIAMLTHCGRGDEIIMGEFAHTFIYEVGGISALGGAHIHTVPNLADGSLDPQKVEEAIRAENIHFPPTRLICLENTHNRCGGTVVPLESMAQIQSVARRHGVSVHLDGARVFNAAVALNVPVSEIASHVDTVQFCLSKGLAAPVGSLVVGAAEFIQRARKLRKMLGGGMRQAGVIAAAGLVAMEQMVERLADDHANARWLAEGLAQIASVSVDPGRVQTNMVMFGFSDPRLTIPSVQQGLAAEGVRINALDAERFRAVTHYGITADDIDRTLLAVRRVVTALAA